MPFNVIIPANSEYSPPLGMGINPITGKTSRIAVDLNESPKTERDEGSTYFNWVMSESERQNFLTLGAKGFYSGFGIDFSGSFNIAQTNKIDIRTSTIQGTKYHKSSYTQPTADDLEKGELSEEAKNLINNPGKFLETFGPCFVAGKIYGRWISGFYALTVSTVDRKTTMDTEITTKYNDILSQAGAEIDAAMSAIQKENSATVLCQYSQVGVNGERTCTNASDFIKAFEDFDPEKDHSTEEAEIGIICYSYDNLTTVGDKLIEVLPNYDYDISLNQLRDIVNQLKYLQKAAYDLRDNNIVQGAYNKNWIEHIIIDLDARIKKIRKLSMADIAELDSNGGWDEISVPDGYKEALETIGKGTFAVKVEYAYDSNFSLIEYPNTDSDPNYKILQIAPANRVNLLNLNHKNAAQTAMVLVGIDAKGTNCKAYWSTQWPGEEWKETDGNSISIEEKGEVSKVIICKYKEQPADYLYLTIPEYTP